MSECNCNNNEVYDNGYNQCGGAYDGCGSGYNNNQCGCGYDNRQEAIRRIECGTQMIRSGLNCLRSCQVRGAIRQIEQGLCYVCEGLNEIRC